MDTLSTKERSIRMGLIKGRDTRPEIQVRRLLFNLGFRYRKHSRVLPGKPDIVFARLKKVIFVHGCFWHRHNCKNGRLPKSRLEFWVPKLEANRIRDFNNYQKLNELGWASLTVWECEVDSCNLPQTLKKFLHA